MMAVGAGESVEEWMAALGGQPEWDRWTVEAVPIAVPIARRLRAQGVEGEKEKETDPEVE
jgi:hypothetical protein